MQRSAVHNDEIGTTYLMRPARRRVMDFSTRRLLLIGGFMTCLVVLAVSLFTALNRHYAGPPPFIQAQPGPIRVRPDHPGGMQVAGQNDDILGATTADQASRLAPPPEAPALQALRARQQAALAAVTAPPAEPPPAPAASVSPSPPAAHVSTAPAPVVPPAPAATPVPAPAPAPAVASVAMPAPPPASPGWRKMTPPEATQQASPQQVLPRPKLPRTALPQLASRDAGAPVLLVPPSTVATPPAATVSRSRIAAVPAAGGAGAVALSPIQTSGKGQVLVQLAAVRAEDDAMSEWQRLSRVLPGLLHGRQPVVMKSARNGTPIWRLRTGGFTSKSEAQDFCNRVKATGAACLVPRS